MLVTIVNSNDSIACEHVRTDGSYSIELSAAKNVSSASNSTNPANSTVSASSNHNTTKACAGHKKVKEHAEGVIVIFLTPPFMCLFLFVISVITGKYKIWRIE